MESSGIGVSLHRLVRISPGHLLCLGLITLFPHSALRLVAQAPGAGPSGAPELPRFTMSEIVAGHNDTLARIPGRWVSAALTAVPESLAARAYRNAATRSGVAPLRGALLASERSRQVMGLYRRSELNGTVRRTLERVRAGLSSDTARARFDHLFRSRGEWIVDVHDAALAWARGRVGGLTWDSARRCLEATRWRAAADSLASDEAVARAIYGLTVLAANDSAAFQAARADLWRADSASATAAFLLLTGYAESRKWYVEGLEFLLTMPWAGAPQGGLSLAGRVRNFWRGGRTEPTEPGAPVPEIHPRLFGHPQAVPHYGVPRSLFERLVRADNSSAQAWLARHGEPALLRALRLLPAGDTGLVLLQAGSEALRLTTVPRQSHESLNGFLEPRDAIAIDPGYSPLLALGAVVHEWQHLIFRRRQLEAFVSGLPPNREPVVELPWVEPYLAEGFAEWSTERILAPLVERWPLLSLGELQKRAGLAQRSVEDQHVMGYALVRALAAALDDQAATTELLLRHAEHPSRILSHPAVARAWSRYGAAPDREFTNPTYRILIPEVTFTIENGYPDVIASRILIPPGDGRRH